MFRFANLRLKTRLIVMMAISSLLMVGFALVGLHGMNDSNARLRAVHDGSLVNLGQFAGILERLIENQPLLRQALTQPTPQVVGAKTDKIEKNADEISRAWKAYTTNNLTPEERRLADKWTADWEHYRNDALQPAVAALRAGQKDEVGQYLKQIVDVHVPALRSGMAALTRLQIDDAQQAYQSAAAQYTRLRNFTIIALVLVMVVGGMFVSVTVRSISGSVHDLEQAATRLADGDLAVQANVRGNDELAHIARAFNGLSERFRRSLGEVSASTTALATAAGELSAVSEQTNRGIGQQQSGTDQVATAMHEMTVTVQEVARNTVTAADAARQADSVAQSGAAEVRQTVAAINALATEVDHAAQVIQRLSEDSKRIGVVSDVIRGIAEQTNLLALNAAIEAARAGEQGRGFAVVADEVRTLASRTQQSTQEIQETIQHLQAGADEAVSVMVRGRSQTQASVEQAARAGGSLESIAAAVSRITDMNAQIASAAEEQSAVVEDISRNIVEISRIGAQTAAGAHQTASASVDLTRLAGQLQALVGRFRL